jgi:hypothetical protein
MTMQSPRLRCVRETPDLSSLWVHALDLIFVEEEPSPILGHEDLVRVISGIVLGEEAVVEARGRGGGSCRILPLMM